MKSFSSFLIVTFLFSSFCILSCSDDDIQEVDLLGEWEIASAFRNGKQTESMRGLFFYFMKDGQLATNMTGSEEVYQFDIDGSFITQRNGKLDADYTVELLTQDSLVLLTTLRSKEFRMILNKKNKLRND